MLDRSTGVTLECMDETTSGEVTESAGVLPLDWSRLDPRLTKALVQAMRLATTVENDGHNKAQDYRYPTQAAIADKARQAMGEAGLHCPMMGWKPSQGLVYGEFLLVHESGACSPIFSAQMPVGSGRDPSKQLAASLSIMRKYVLAGLLNMGWRDPTEDIDADQPNRGGGGNRGQRQQQQSRPPRREQTPPKRDKPNPRTEALITAREWAKKLIEWGVGKDEIYSFATGCGGPMPEGPTMSVLAAITLAGNVCARSISISEPMPTAGHEALLAFIVEHTDAQPLWCDGKKTSAGERVDS